MKFKTKSKQLKEMTDLYWKAKDEVNKLKTKLEKANERLSNQLAECDKIIKVNDIIRTEYENYIEQVNGKRTCTKICEDCKNAYVHKQKMHILE